MKNKIIYIIIIIVGELLFINFSLYKLAPNVFAIYVPDCGGCADTCVGRYDGGCNCASGTRNTCCTNIINCSYDSICAQGTAGDCTCTSEGAGCYDAHSVSCSCCTPSCGTCTLPACNTGYTSTDPKNLCTTSYLQNPAPSCDRGDDGCGGDCGDKTGKCYLIETNTSFLKSDLTSSGPTSITMTVDGKDVQLSTDPNNPTVIKKPASGSTDVQLTVPTFVNNGGTSSAGGYYFQADNYGVNNVWEGWTTCSGKAPGEDFCIDGGTTSTSNTITFTPTSQSISTVLAENAKGKISAQYYTVDKCDTGKKYSTASVGYYVVDTLPDVPTPCTPGDAACTILTDIGVDATVKGCTSTTYTGNEVNNPLHLKATVTDANGVSDIQSLIVWFSKDTTVPTSTTTSNSCSTGYYMAADNICCPNNTTYTDGVCKASTKFKTCPTGYSAAGYTATGEQVCCPSGYTYTGSSCTLSISPRQTATLAISCTTFGDYIKVGVSGTHNLCCPSGMGYNGTSCTISSMPRIISCPSGYVQTSSGSSTCCPSSTTLTSYNTCTAPSSKYYNGSASDIGVMIMKNGSTWESPYIYGANMVSSNTFSWKLLQPDASGNKYLKVGTTNLIEVNLLVDVDDSQPTGILFDLNLEFSSTSSIFGLFNTYLAGIDNSMKNGTTIDQSYVTKVFNWGIDLVNPVTNPLTQSVASASSVNITWGASDTSGSGIDKVLLSPYRVGGVGNPSAVTLYDKNSVNMGSITPVYLPEDIDSNVGKYTDTLSSWSFTNNAGEKDLLDIGNNENGKIDVYATTYDKACNVSSNYTSVDLDPWFTTRGGVLYSKGAITSNPKDVSTSTNLQGGTLKNFSNAQLKLLDTGTELLSTRTTSIVNVSHSTLGMAEALGVYDSNNVKNTWFDTLVKAFSNIQSSLERIYDLTDLCNGTTCYMYSEDENADIAIPSDFTCSKPTLFISTRDININPNIYVTNTANQLAGCVFLAKRNINILPGTYASDGSSTVKYDYIEGFFIAEQKIVFELGDQSKVVRDGIEVKGSLVAFGTDLSDGSSAIEINRSLRLFNQSNPTVVTTYDNRYSNIAELFFGTNTPTYRQEIGFKSF